jgi:hypothetical protein
VCAGYGDRREKVTNAFIAKWQEVLDEWSRRHGDPYELDPRMQEMIGETEDYIAKLEAKNAALFESASADEATCCSLSNDLERYNHILIPGCAPYLPEDASSQYGGIVKAVLDVLPKAFSDAGLGRAVREMPYGSHLEHNEKGTTYEVEPEGEDGGSDYTDAEWAYETLDLMLCGMTVDDVIGDAALAALRESEGHDA